MTASAPVPPTPLSYRDAGVDIDAGDSLVERIKPFAKRTLQSHWLASAPVTVPKNRVCTYLPNFVRFDELFRLGE